MLVNTEFIHARVDFECGDIIEYDLKTKDTESVILSLLSEIRELKYDRKVLEDKLGECQKKCEHLEEINEYYT